jgi:hypothetical protein
MGNAAESLREQGMSQRVFMVVCRVPPGGTERCQEVVGRAKRGKEDGICDEGDSRVGRE